MVAASKTLKTCDDLLLLELEELVWSAGDIDRGTKGVVWWPDGVPRALEPGNIDSETSGHLSRYFPCPLHVTGPPRLHKVVLLWWPDVEPRAMEPGHIIGGSALHLSRYAPCLLHFIGLPDLHKVALLLLTGEEFTLGMSKLQFLSLTECREDCVSRSRGDGDIFSERWLTKRCSLSALEHNGWRVSESRPFLSWLANALLGRLITGSLACSLPTEPHFSFFPMHVSRKRQEDSKLLA